MAAIVEELTIEASPQRVWGAITEPDEIVQWWAYEAQVKPEVGSLAESRLRQGAFVMQFEVAELDQDEKVHWISKSPAQWAGSSVTWQLTPVHNGTKVLFTHDGFAQVEVGYERTRGAWVYFLASLKSYLETGKGTPGVPPSVKQGRFPVNPLMRCRSFWKRGFSGMATRTTLNTEQEALWYLGGLRIIQAIGEQAGRAVHLTESVLPAGTHIYAHRHRDEEEGVYVAEGEATFACGERVMSAAAGTLLFLPQHVHQHLEVGKSAPFRYLSWMTARGFAHHVLPLGEPGQALVLSPPPFASHERIQHLAMLLRNATTPSLEDFYRFS